MENRDKGNFKRRRIQTQPFWDTSLPSTTAYEKKKYVVFDFSSEKRGSLYTVPFSWVVMDKRNSINEANNSQDESIQTLCYWPPRGSVDERRLGALIKLGSLPNFSSWMRMPGKIKGVFPDEKSADIFLDSLIGSKATSSEPECEHVSDEAIESEESDNGDDNRLDNEAESPKVESFEDEVLRRLDCLQKQMSGMIESLHGAISGESAQKISPTAASEILKEAFQCPVSNVTELEPLERLLELKTTRQQLRNCLYSLAPKGDNVNSLTAARGVCRFIAPDGIFQHFNRDGSVRSSKKSLKHVYPRIDQIITSVVMAVSKVGLEKARSGLSGPGEMY